MPFAVDTLIRAHQSLMRGDKPGSRRPGLGLKLQARGAHNYLLRRPCSLVLIRVWCIFIQKAFR